MFQIEEHKSIVFSTFFIPILICIWLVSLFNLSNLAMEYKSCIILPLLFIIGYSLFMLYKHNSFMDIHLIILLLFFIKLYIFPMLVIYNGGFNIQEYNINIIDNINNAILIQSCEWVAVIIGLIFIKTEQKEVREFDKKVDLSVNKRVRQIIILCCIIIFVAIIIYPSLLYKFRPIFFTSEGNEILWKQKSLIAKSTMSSLIYYPTNWLINITRLSLVYFLIVTIWRKRKKSSQLLPIFISFIAITIGLVLIVPDDVSASIISALCLLALMTKLYPEKKKQIIYNRTALGRVPFFCVN